MSTPAEPEPAQADSHETIVTATDNKDIVAGGSDEVAAVETTTAATSKKAAKREPSKSEFSKTSLFISTLPFDSTNEDLVEFFSQIGPLKSGFIIQKDKKHSGKFALLNCHWELRESQFFGMKSSKV
jgi:RNA recognition motif-containing protein